MDEVPGEVERLKWVGIYPQKQGGDAFMLRLKVPGGVLTPEQTRVIGQIAIDFANGPIPNPHFGNNFLDITTRQDVQMHWIKMEDVPEIWRRLEEVGMTTVQACGDSARNVLCCPVSGLGHDEVIDAFPVAQAISDYFTGNREYANLPRKFKMSRSEEHTSELQSRQYLVCRLLLEKKKHLASTYRPALTCSCHRFRSIPITPRSYDRA